MNVSGDLPRGVRNHNPGNIIRNHIQWQGMAAFQTDPRFVVFDEPYWGVRALMKLLLRYYQKHGLNTVQSLINRWAPPHENATDHYAHHVAKLLNVKRRQVLDVTHPPTLIALAQAIVRHENGAPPTQSKNWYPQSLYLKAAATVLNKEILT